MRLWTRNDEVNLACPVVRYPCHNLRERYFGHISRSLPINMFKMNLPWDGVTRNERRSRTSPQGLDIVFVRRRTSNEANISLERYLSVCSAWRKETFPSKVLRFPRRVNKKQKNILFWSFLFLMVFVLLIILLWQTLYLLFWKTNKKRIVGISPPVGG